ncbi:MAG: peptidoglycan DD-metalloendopeptidase family protein [Bacteroidales bacterium]|jgi:murein DD-endopeptidase MepM/ murein hydrolase activator NlpD|nr:peptidoglycan DD-metalloendopeptidase family protein [Bacteroidales bacterium]
MQKIQKTFWAIVLSVFGFALSAQTDTELIFTVDNDQIMANDEFEIDSLGYYDYSDEGSGSDNNCAEFIYFPWMPGYGLYRNFDISQMHYRHSGQIVTDTLILGSYCHPAKYPITSKYGKRRRRMHYGYDIGYPYGTPVAVAFDGIVRISKNTAGGYGELIVVRHGNGLETYYGHLSKRLVNLGQLVKAGDTIALGGSTGRSTGNHLHFETRYLGIPFNPNRLIDFEKYCLRADTFHIRANAEAITLLTQSTIDKYAQVTSTATGSSSGTAAKPAGGTYNNNGYTYYRVKSGDTLSHIANRYQTTVSKLKSLNGLRSDFLSIGQRLRVK